MEARYGTVPRVRIELVRDATSDYPEESIRCASAVWRLLREEMTSWDRERFLTLLLDGRHKVLGLEEVSVGTATASLVHPREIFKGIILANAVAFILVHNHPSGDPSPSREDRDVTERLKKAFDWQGGGEPEPGKPS